MNPDLEDFLEAAFAPVEPTSDTIRRVVVEPDYNASTDGLDTQELRHELTRILSGLTENNTALSSYDGQEVKLSSQYPNLSKCLRRITLHSDSIEGSWIEVSPPGNWI